MEDAAGPLMAGALILSLLLMAVVAAVYATGILVGILVAIGGISFAIAVLLNYVSALGRVLISGLRDPEVPVPPEPAYRQYFFRQWWYDYRRILSESYSANIAFGAQVLSFKEGAEKSGSTWWRFVASLSVYIVLAIGALVGAGVYVASGLLHLTVVLSVCLLAVVGAGTFRTFEALSMVWRRIFLVCPHAGCYKPILLPIYLCPSCNAEHKNLVPGAYGTFQRRCQCGHLLPTLFLFGRNRLQSLCPHPECRGALSTVLARNLHIPVVAGASAGKSTYLMASAMSLETEAVDRGIRLSFPNPDHEVDFRHNKTMLESGSRLFKTAVQLPSAFQLQVEDRFGSDCSLHVYDAAGEIFSNTDDIRRQAFYKYMHGVAFLIDPFSLAAVRQNHDVREDDLAGASREDPQEVLDRFLQAFREARGQGARKANIPIAVVLTKVDTLNIQGGLQKIAQSLVENVGEESLESQSVKSWLDGNGAGNVIRALEQNFQSVRYFAVSALGRAPDTSGEAFEPQRVLEPLGWFLRQYGIRIERGTPSALQAALMRLRSMGAIKWFATGEAQLDPATSPPAERTSPGAAALVLLSLAPLCPEYRLAFVLASLGLGLWGFRRARQRMGDGAWTACGALAVVAALFVSQGVGLSQHRPILQAAAISRQRNNDPVYLSIQPHESGTPSVADEGIQAPSRATPPVERKWLVSPDGKWEICAEDGSSYAPAPSGPDRAFPAGEKYHGARLVIRRTQGASEERVLGEVGPGNGVDPEGWVTHRMIIAAWSPSSDEVVVHYTTHRREACGHSNYLLTASISGDLVTYEESDLIKTARKTGLLLKSGVQWGIRPLKYTKPGVVLIEFSDDVEDGTPQAKPIKQALFLNKCKRIVLSRGSRNPSDPAASGESRPAGIASLPSVATGKPPESVGKEVTAQAPPSSSVSVPGSSKPSPALEAGRRAGSSPESEPTVSPAVDSARPAQGSAPVASASPEPAPSPAETETAEPDVSSPNACAVRIITHPAGANVYGTATGRLYGSTPLLLPSVKPGRFEYRISLAGYRDSFVRGTARLGSVSRIQERLSRIKTGLETGSTGLAESGDKGQSIKQPSAKVTQVRITSQPPGARVLGLPSRKLRGTTPCVVTLTPGAFRFSVEADDCVAEVVSGVAVLGEVNNLPVVVLKSEDEQDGRNSSSGSTPSNDPPSPDAPAVVAPDSTVNAGPLGPPPPPGKTETESGAVEASTGLGDAPRPGAERPAVTQAAGNQTSPQISAGPWDGNFKLNGRTFRFYGRIKRTARGFEGFSVDMAGPFRNDSVRVPLGAPLPGNARISGAIDSKGHVHFTKNYAADGQIVTMEGRLEGAGRQIRGRWSCGTESGDFYMQRRRGLFGNAMAGLGSMMGADK